MNVLIRNLSSDTLLGVRKITGTDEMILRNWPHLQHEISILRNDARRSERLAVYALLYEMTGNRSLVISHNADGKPSIDGYNISISHTKGYVAILISTTKRVGIDIEQRSERVKNIAKRFIREDEWTNDVSQQLLIWSAKETVYKLFSEQHLQLFEMRSEMNCGQNDEIIKVENIRDNVQVSVYYTFSDNYVLTWATL